MEVVGKICVDIEVKFLRGFFIFIFWCYGFSDWWYEVGVSICSGNFVIVKVCKIKFCWNFGSEYL